MLIYFRNLVFEYIGNIFEFDSESNMDNIFSFVLAEIKTQIIIKKLLF